MSAATENPATATLSTRPAKKIIGLKSNNRGVLTSKIATDAMKLNPIVPKSGHSMATPASDAQTTFDSHVHVVGVHVH